MGARSAPQWGGFAPHTENGATPPSPSGLLKPRLKHPSVTQHRDCGPFSQQGNRTYPFWAGCRTQKGLCPASPPLRGDRTQQSGPSRGALFRRGTGSVRASCATWSNHPAASGDRTWQSARHRSGNNSTSVRQ
eukprot:gene13029-biopygen1960